MKKTISPLFEQVPKDILQTIQPFIQQINEIKQIKQTIPDISMKLKDLLDQFQGLLSEETQFDRLIQASLYQFHCFASDLDHLAFIHYELSHLPMLTSSSSSSSSYSRDKNISLSLDQTIGSIQIRIKEMIQEIKTLKSIFIWEFQTNDQHQRMNKLLTDLEVLFESTQIRLEGLEIQIETISEETSQKYVSSPSSDKDYDLWLNSYPYSPEQSIKKPTSISSTSTPWIDPSITSKKSLSSKLTIDDFWKKQSKHLICQQRPFLSFQFFEDYEEQFPSSSSSSTAVASVKLTPEAVPSKYKRGLLKFATLTPTTFDVIDTEIGDWRFVSSPEKKANRGSTPNTPAKCTFQLKEERVPLSVFDDVFTAINKLEYKPIVMPVKPVVLPSEPAPVPVLPPKDKVKTPEDANKTLGNTSSLLSVKKKASVSDEETTQPRERSGSKHLLDSDETKPSQESKTSLFSSPGNITNNVVKPLQTNLFTASTTTSTPSISSANTASLPKPITTEDRVRAIYQTHNPAKLDEIPTLLTKYAGKEMELIGKLCKKYGIDPNTVDSLLPKTPQQPAAVLTPTPPTTTSSLFNKPTGSTTSQSPFALNNNSSTTNTSSATSSSLFGGAKPSSGLFGSNNNSNTPSSATTPFSAPAANTTNAPAPNSLFSSPSLNQQPTTNNSSLFGAKSPFASSPQPNANSAFGANPSSAFGSTTPSSGFGSINNQAPSTGFGSAAVPSSLFGGNNNQSMASGPVTALNVTQRVKDIYLKHNPSKLNEVPALLEKYRGREQELVDRLEKKYNVSSQAPAQNSGLLSGLGSSMGSSMTNNTSSFASPGSSLFNRPASGGFGSSPFASATNNSLFQQNALQTPQTPTPFGTPNQATGSLFGGSGFGSLKF